MAYFLADSTGYLTDFASIGGLARFRRWAEKQARPIRSFIEDGCTESLTALKAALDDVSDVPAPVQEQVDLLRKYLRTAKDVLIISDGT